MHWNEVRSGILISFIYMSLPSAYFHIVFCWMRLNEEEEKKDATGFVFL